MTNLVILASGKGSRLEGLTTHIPKCLVNIGQKTALALQLDYWSEYDIEETILVVHSDHQELTRAYLSANGYDYVKLAFVDSYNGSYDAIKESIKQYPAVQHNTFFNWCDVIPQSKIDLEDLSKDIIYTYGTECRFSSIYGKIREVDHTGNVIGIFYKTEVDTSLTGIIDLVETFKDNTFISKAINNVIDFGDKFKLVKALKGVSICREFNEVIINEDTVVKRPTSDLGKTLNSRETLWYEKLPNGFKHTPKILNTDDTDFTFTMERLKGEMLFKTRITKDILNDVSNLLSDLHTVESNTVPIKEHKLNVKYEAYDKVITRTTEVQGYIDGFGEITHINGIPKIDKSLKKICSHAYDLLTQDLNGKSEVKYNLIHGDCNFSNLILKDDGTIGMIDPRGYFGYSQLYGPIEYDLAKVLYAVSGYDAFNASPTFEISIKEKNIMFDIETLIDPIEQYYLQTDPKVIYWLPIIWLSLAGYFKNNPIKSVVAHYHGLYLAKLIYKGL